MAQVSIIGTEGDAKAELELIRDNRPTPLLVALACAELCIDTCIGYAVYRILKAMDR